MSKTSKKIHKQQTNWNVAHVYFWMWDCRTIVGVGQANCCQPVWLRVTVHLLWVRSIGSWVCFRISRTGRKCSKDKRSASFFFSLPLLFWSRVVFPIVYFLPFLQNVGEQWPKPVLFCLYRGLYYPVIWGFSSAMIRIPINQPEKMECHQDFEQTQVSLRYCLHIAMVSWHLSFWNPWLVTLGRGVKLVTSIWGIKQVTFRKLVYIMYLFAHVYVVYTFLLLTKNPATVRVCCGPWFQRGNLVRWLADVAPPGCV